VPFLGSVSSMSCACWGFSCSCRYCPWTVPSYGGLALVTGFCHRCVWSGPGRSAVSFCKPAEPGTAPPATPAEGCGFVVPGICQSGTRSTCSQPPRMNSTIPRPDDSTPAALPAPRGFSTLRAGSSGAIRHNDALGLQMCAARPSTQPLTGTKTQPSVDHPKKPADVPLPPFQIAYTQARA
jgi:hypothetical protein